METPSNINHHYFSSPKNYFWRWADNGQVIEWVDGTTICFRDDLINTLEQAFSLNLPSLHSVILILAAQQDNYRSGAGVGILNGLLKSLPEENDGSANEVIEYHLHQALQFLDNVSALPKKLRKRQFSIQMIREIFDESTFEIGGFKLRDAIQDLKGGRINELIFNKVVTVTKERFKRDLTTLSKALHKFPKVSQLEHRLMIGIDSLPEPVEIKLAETGSTDLLDELAKDERTEGISRLTRQLIAAINIPAFSNQNGDHSYGGIADITNRGNYDKLLLTELAQDEHTLTARLVNNEALYYRREEPPDQPQHQRVILLDTTIKMWGLARVYAFSAALACSRNVKRHQSVSSYALAGIDYQKIRLDNKEEVLLALGLLDVSLGCGHSLEQFVIQELRGATAECIFISCAESFHSEAFQRSFSKVREELSYVLTVSRNGDFEVMECKKGRLKSTSSAKLDINKILFSKTGADRTHDFSQVYTPAFLLQNKAPLLFPKVRISIDNNFIYSHSDGSILVVSSNQRLLLLMGRDFGAIELMSFIEKGNYCVGEKFAGMIYIMVYNTSDSKILLYKIETGHNNVKKEDLSSKFSLIHKIVCQTNLFYITTYNGQYSYDILTDTINELKVIPQIGNVEIKTQREINKKDYNNELVLINLKSLFINLNKELSFGVLHLGLKDKHIKIYEQKGLHGTCYSMESKENLSFFANDNIKFRKRVWADGSSAIIDSRGMLHLKSSDQSIPEITIVLAINRVTTCWASDGNFCGSPYFLPITNNQSMDCKTFYDNYINKFISQLQ
jgi:hypothetical protein